MQQSQPQPPPLQPAEQHSEPLGLLPLEQPHVLPEDQHLPERLPPLPHPSQHADLPAPSEKPLAPAELPEELRMLSPHLLEH